MIRNLEYSISMSINKAILCGFLFLSLPALGQNAAIDSLKHVLATTSNDTIKVNTLIELSSAQRDVNLDEAIQSGNEARLLASQVGYQKGLAYAHKAIAMGYFFQANYKEAALEFQNSLSAFDSLKLKSGIANILSNLGATYFNAGDDTKAIDFYLRSLRISEEIDDKLRIGTALNNIGGVYNNKPATVDKGLKYFLRGLPIFEKIEYPDGVATVSMNIGEIYLQKSDYDSAIYYFEKSLEILNGTIDATFPLTHLAEIYAQRGEFETALKYHNEAIEIAKSLDAKFELAQSIIGLANTRKKQGKLRESIKSYLQAEQIARSVSAKKELKDIYSSLSDSYAALGDFRNAYKYKTNLTSIKDTLYNNDNDKKIQQLQFNFDIEKKQSEINLLTKDSQLRELIINRQKTLNYAAGITVFLVLILAVGVFNRNRFIRRTNKIIKGEKERSEQLLLNILPEETAKELQEKGHTEPRFYESVSVLFTDFKGFSSIAGRLSPQELVAELNDYFIAFDEIVGRHGMEKIKTIGDAYMCAGGIPTPSNTHALNAVEAALAMQEFMSRKNEDRSKNGLMIWELRIGIHTGPIVAGVVGKKKYAYDIWGDTVNVASRMESNGEPGKVNISSATYNLVREKFECIYRGKISAKNIGDVDMYFVGEEIEISVPV
jgi:adenylate cyclase